MKSFLAEGVDKMCIIIDNNVAARVFLTRDDPDFQRLSADIIRGNAIAFYGGKLFEEYKKNNRLRERILQLDRAGRARTISMVTYSKELKWVNDSKICVSNDQHIIALARSAKVHLVCTLDMDLMKDIKNPLLLRGGKVYSRLENHHLVKTCC